jgi:hypothetical protein
MASINLFNQNKRSHLDSVIQLINICMNYGTNPFFKVLSFALFHFKHFEFIQFLKLMLSKNKSWRTKPNYPDNLYAVLYLTHRKAGSLWFDFVSDRLRDYEPLILKVLFLGVSLKQISPRLRSKKSIERLVVGLSWRNPYGIYAPDLFGDNFNYLSQEAKNNPKYIKAMINSGQTHVLEYIPDPVIRDQFTHVAFKKDPKSILYTSQIYQDNPELLIKDNFWGFFHACDIGIKSLEQQKNLHYIRDVFLSHVTEKLALEFKDVIVKKLIGKTFFSEFSFMSKLNDMNPLFPKLERYLSHFMSYWPLEDIQKLKNLSSKNIEFQNMFEKELRRRTIQNINLHFNKKQVLMKDTIKKNRKINFNELTSNALPCLKSDDKICYEST